MNYWTELSVEYANQRSYLDDLFKVYPTIPEGIREIDENIWDDVEKAFDNQDNLNLLKGLLKFNLFPIKDSYVAYLKRDPSSIDRNPATVDRLCGRLYEMGLNDIYKKCTEPKETNRQIGPMFRRWVQKGSLGVELINNASDFIATTENAVFDSSDNELGNFAKEHLNYSVDKGLDFVGKFNNKYVIGEAKFLTDFGGHQNAQFNDAIATLKDEGTTAIKIAILDGVLYIEGRNKMHRYLSLREDYNIMSSLVLREFLFQV
ncbi:MAG: restriction endonuclease [Methanobacterium sp.]